MRYYAIELNSTSEEIRENDTENIICYQRQSPLEALNVHLYSKLENGLRFFTYRETEGKIYCVLILDEKTWSYNDAYGYVSNELRMSAGIKKMYMTHELTMYEVVDCIQECRRRELSASGSYRNDETAVVIINYIINKDLNMYFQLNEKIIQKTPVHMENKKIYDASVVKELERISQHKNTTKFKGNPVHYMIGSHSLAATASITETITQTLAKSDWLSGRRIELISEISPDLYKENTLENVIENNYGGVIVLDLTPKFGCVASSYAMVCEYIGKLVNRYKNHCLFVFTYNIEEPGFSYQLLNILKKKIIMIDLKEGTMDRDTAISYMKELIHHSNNRTYEDQTDEFMERYPGNRFTQSDVLEAFEQFDLWALNKNILQADYRYADTVVLDRDKDENSAYEKLQQIIGLSAVKQQINEIIAADIVEKERKKRHGKEYEAGTMHMIFAGNPGTAKTTMARLFAEIAKEKGVLKSGVFVECGGMDLDGMFCVEAIRNAFLEAKGGVLFIDEAYSMKSSIAVTALIQMLEQYKDEVVTILAGYSEKMDQFMELNEGLKSRIPYRIDFSDYNADELTDIFKVMINAKGFSATEEAIKEAHDLCEQAMCLDNFGNGRYVRNLIDQATKKQSVRLLDEKENAEEINEADLFTITKEDIKSLNQQWKPDRPVGSARKELDEMIGLTSVKDVIYKAIASYKFKKLCADRGISNDKPSLHMVFTGNPGTAKTTVARLIGEILKDETILSSGKFVEVGRADLVGTVVGSTAPLVKQKFKEAQGGILFIDEAYSLCDGYSGGYGDEAINTLVQELENQRENIVVIFAGYPKQMEEFLERNPGMKSRIAFQVQFEDYSVEELCEITSLMLSRKQLSITEDAMKKLRTIYERVAKTNDFGNGRYVRKLLEEAEMNLALRMENCDVSQITTEQITLLEEADIPMIDAEKPSKKRPIGFCAS